jgi:hypothetical protein
MASALRQAGRDEFYTFFCHWATDRSTAVGAIVAGCIAGLLLTLTFMVGTVASALQTGWTSHAIPTELALTCVTGLVTLGTWKRILAAPIIGALIGIGIERWLMGRHELAMAVIAFVPFVCGFFTAARGVFVLRKLLTKSDLY